MKRKEIITHVLALYPVASQLAQMDSHGHATNNERIVELIDSMLL